MSDDVLSYLLYLLAVVPDFLRACTGKLNSKNSVWRNSLVLGLVFVAICPILLFLAWLTPEVISIAVTHGGFGNLTPTSCRYLLILVIIFSGYFREPVIDASSS